jgi:small subunit ribosomal protein S1
LSLRAVSGHEASREHVEKYKAESHGGSAHKAPVSSSTTTLGDLINWKSERES